MSVEKYAALVGAIPASQARMLQLNAGCQYAARLFIRSSGEAQAPVSALRDWDR
jgi:hypothetical protein